MLIGRDRERAALDRLIAAARQGIGGAVVVHGEPGIGKTALVDESVTAAGVRALRTCGYESEADLPFATLGDLLRPLLDRLPDIPTAQAEVVERALGISSGTGVDVATIEVATVSLLTAAAEAGPLVVMVDDLPWADTSSRNAILHAARRAGALPFAMILIARTTDMTPEMAELDCVVLEPLSSQEAVDVVRADAPDAASPVVDLVVARARGNPLALHELLRGLSLDQRAGAAELEDPIPIAQEVLLSYRQRIDRLPEATQEALLLAVADGRGDLTCIADALEVCASSVSAFDAAERDGLVSLVRGSVAFRHPLVRSVVYHSVDAAARRRAHALLASVDQDPDRAAWHLGRSVVGPDAEAAKAMTRLGERALGRGADATAARALGRAAELTVGIGDRAALYAKAARAANRGGDPPLATRFVELARPLIGDDPLAKADLAMLDSDLRMRRGDLERASGDLAAHAEAIAALDPRRAMVMLLMAAKLHVYRMEGVQGLATVRQAIELTGGGAPDLLQMASLTMTATMAADPDATRLARTSANLAMATTRGHLHTMSIGWPLVWLDEHELARRFLGWSVAVQRDGGYHSYLPQSLLPAAELDMRTGRWVQARNSAAEARRLFIESKQPVDAGLAAALLARIEAICGAEEQCLANASIAVDGDADTGLRAASAFAHAAVGHLALSLRRFDDAVNRLGRAMSIASDNGVRESGVLMVDGDLVEALVRVGRIDAAQQVTEELERRAGEAGRPSLLGLAARCRALVSPDDAIEHFELALTHHESASLPFELARTELCFAERLHRINRRADARTLARRALETFESLGARIWCETATTEWRATGGSSQRPSGAAVGTLSRRERDVARRVAGGATNKEVASELFVNEKTVEFHLGNVYRKLGLRSRSELAKLFAAAADPH